MLNIIWINGATTKAGQALAQHYSTLDAKMILSGQNRDELYALKMKCKGNPMNIHILEVDQSDPSKMLDFTKSALRIFGRIDTLILCNDFTHQSSIAKSNLTDAKAIMDHQFWSPSALAKAVLLIMNRQESGHMIVFTSLAGKVGLANKTVLCSAQHALYGYFDALRAEQKLPIHVSMILGELADDETSVAKFVKQLEKKPEELTLSDQDGKLLRLKFLRPKAFFNKMKNPE